MSWRQGPTFHAYNVTYSIKNKTILNQNDGDILLQVPILKP